MAPEFRYSLTRICLRTGQLSLSQRMADVFPEAGKVRVLDTIDDRELELRVTEPRKVAGLAEYLDRHRLDVNDQIQIRSLEGGRIALTALPRKRRKFDEKAVGELLDSLTREPPRTEAEIRALHPRIPPEYPLAEALEAHPLMRLVSGRWVGVTPLTTSAAESAEASEATAAGDGESMPADTDGTRATAGAPGPLFDPRFGVVPDSGDDSPAASDDDAGEESPTRAEASGSAATDDPFAAVHEGWSERWSEWPDSGALDDQKRPVDRREGQGGGSPHVTGERDRSQHDASERDRAQGAGGEPDHGRRDPSQRDPSQPVAGERDSGRLDPSPRDRGERDRGQPGRAAAVTPYPRGVLFPGEAALNSQRPGSDLKFVNRAREALTGFGYRVEGLPHGMLLASADLGRRKHTVLVRVLADGERLDWAALLARRREQTADHLAVIGDHRDLHRLTAPAELARATLWSWDGIARVQTLAKSILIGPFDLEPHFAKDGLFGNGLQQFERTVGRMIAEKGALSSVIARLGTLRAPAVFVLDDLVEGDLQREQVAKALDLLAQAPFHLVARVDRGEYCLRHTVADSLAHLSEYAISLGQRLPGGTGRRARIGAASGGEDKDRSDERHDLGVAEGA